MAIPALLLSGACAVSSGKITEIPLPAPSLPLCPCAPLTQLLMLSRSYTVLGQLARRCLLLSVEAQLAWEGEGHRVLWLELGVEGLTVVSGVDVT